MRAPRPDTAAPGSPRLKAAYASSTRRAASHGEASEYKAAAAKAPAATGDDSTPRAQRRTCAGRPAARSTPSTATAGAVTAMKSQSKSTTPWTT